MELTLVAGEPAADGWRAVDATELMATIRAVDEPLGRPRIVAVDGRSASGKSTLAHRLADAVPSSVVVHTDDLAWNEPFFTWGHLLRDGVLTPLRRGEAVRFRPPMWDEHGRDGMIQVPADASLVIVEGVGASQRAVAPLLDASMWVQSDFAEAERRGIERDVTSGVNGNREQAVAFWREWMSQELRFLDEDRPWERADVVVAGTPTITLDEGQFAVMASRPAQRR